jgi:hypothetical protein
VRGRTLSRPHFKHSPGDKKKAPSASLARSIFVTWLNGVPYDTRDSPFLNEMKLTAAEYQTHSLAIANNHYDKDAASEAKLRVLVDFCDSYSQWQPHDEAAAVGAAAGGKEAAMLSENVDSDDEESKDDATRRSPFSGGSSGGSCSGCCGPRRQVGWWPSRHAAGQ